MQPPEFELRATTGWVAFSAMVLAGGWLLSGVGELNRMGCAFLLVGAILIQVWVWARSPSRGGEAMRRALRRLRTPWAAGWFLLWLLAVLGGAAHAPNNIDALTYRLPRVLHWLADGGWHWLAVNVPRMNYSGVGMEWQMAPILAVFRSDRLLFLLNALPALLMPGLVFSVFRDMGVAGRIAAKWMWLLPTSHVFILQAGGIGNDANSAIYLLAAFHFIAVARRRRNVKWLMLAALAAALLTAWKSSNLPLLLPIAVFTWPTWRELKPSRIMFASIVLMGGLFSAVPILTLNFAHTGHWSGDPANEDGVRLSSPVAGVVGNVTQAFWQNVAPPVFPMAGAWNAWSSITLEPKVRGFLGTDFPRYTLRVGELPQEEWAGLGLGVVILALGGARGTYGVRVSWFGWASAGAVAAFTVGIGSEMTARLLAPYYPVLLVPILARSGQSAWWDGKVARVLGFLSIASTACVLVVSPARPLLPLAAWIEGAATRSSRPSVERLGRVYRTYAARADALVGIRQAIPSSAHLVGLIATGDDAETSLWRPFGERRIVHFAPWEQPQAEWVVVRADAIWSRTGDEAAWLEKWSGTVVKRLALRLKAARAPEEWVLIRLNRAGKIADP